MLDLSLRLRSSTVPLGPLVAEIEAPLEHLYVAGEPIAVIGRHAGRVAERHYATTKGVRVAKDEEVLVWLQRIISDVNRQPDLLDQLRSGQVEGVLWIARMYEDKPTLMPVIGSEIIAAARQCGLQIFLENYSDFDEEGVPKRQWLA